MQIADPTDFSTPIGPNGPFSRRPASPTFEAADPGGSTIDKPHVLWVEIGFGVAVAIFAALVVIGREAGTPAFNAMMLGFLGVFIAFTVVAEIAAVRAEQRVAESAARRTAAAARRRPATET